MNTCLVAQILAFAGNRLDIPRPNGIGLPLSGAVTEAQTRDKRIAQVGNHKLSSKSDQYRKVSK